MTNLKSMALSIMTVALLIASPGWAGPIGLSTTDPALGASSVTIDYLAFFDDGDLSAFGATIDSFTGEEPAGFGELSFIATFDISDPVNGPFGGGFAIDDANGVFLEGILEAIGFVEDVIELQFGSLSGSGTSGFGSMVLAEIAFLSPLGPNPFTALADGESYETSVTISNVSSVPAPSVLALLAPALLALGFFRHKRVTG